MNLEAEDIRRMCVCRGRLREDVAARTSCGVLRTDARLRGGAGARGGHKLEGGAFAEAEAQLGVRLFSPSTLLRFTNCNAHKY